MRVVFEFNISDYKNDYTLCENIISNTEKSLFNAKDDTNIESIIKKIASVKSGQRNVLRGIYLTEADNFIQAICDNQTGKKNSNKIVYRLFPKQEGYQINNATIRSISCHYHFFVGAESKNKQDDNEQAIAIFSLHNLINYLLIKLKYNKCSIAFSNKNSSDYFRFASFFKLLCWRDIMQKAKPPKIQLEINLMLSSTNNENKYENENNNEENFENEIKKLIINSDFYNTTYALNLAWNSQKKDIPANYSRLPIHNFYSKIEEVFPALIIDNTTHNILDEKVDDNLVKLIDFYAKHINKSAGYYLRLLINGGVEESLGDKPEERIRQCLRAFIAEKIYSNLCNAKSEEIRSNSLDILKNANMSLGSALLLSMQHNKSISTQDDWNSAIIEAIEYGTAIRQLTENIIHHATYKKGIFLLRTYDYGNNSNKYAEDLSTRFKNYSGLSVGEYSEADSKIDNRFLELQIADLSDKGILDTFIAEISKNFIVQTFKEKHEKESIEKLTLDSFFSRVGEFWTIYNKNPDNRTKHKGLIDFYYAVNSSNGAFRVRSRTKEKEYCQFNSWENAENDRDSHVGGTMYNILLPQNFREPIESFEIINIRPHDWNLDVISNYMIKPININIENNLDGTQAKKEEKALEIRGYLEREIIKINNEALNEASLKGVVIQINCTVINDSTLRDASLKALEQILCTMNESTSIVNFAIILDYEHEIKRLLKALIKDAENKDKLSKAQIYLSDKYGSLQILWRGESLEEVVGRDNSRALQMGTVPIISRLVSKKIHKNETVYSYDSGSDIPFAHIANIEDATLYELSVKYLLEQSIQEKKHGYKLEKVHMRLGSKIHIHDFYQAESLFQNNYYTRGFALTLARKIKEQIITFIESKKPSERIEVVLMGYERYSELMLYQLTGILNDDCMDKKEHATTIYRYTIFSYTDSGNMRLDPQIDFNANTLVIQIVPIISTLTTFSKMFEVIKSKIKAPLLNLGLILVKDKRVNAINNTILYNASKEDNISIEQLSCSLESTDKQSNTLEDNTLKTIVRYWKEFDSKEKTIVTKFNIGENNNKVHYLISINTSWEDPINCSLCYPKNIEDEQPLFETNKASVIPTAQFGIEHEWKEYKEIPDEAITKYEKYLKGNVLYGHIYRGGNHFQYYFKTKNIFSQAQADQSIKTWLEKEYITKTYNNTFKILDNNTCNIIISPMHYSNAGFLHEVNRWYFKEAALILHSEVEKEFRDNFMAKYKYISSLIQKAALITKDNTDKFIFNFYFVDDTIVSGSRYSRAKSIVKSLVPEGGEKICNVFKGVFLLVNRCSDSTKRKYVDNKDDFCSFIELYIPSLRIHQDACIQCKIGNEAKQLYERTATNRMAAYGESRHYKHRLTSIEDFESDIEINHERVYKRMYCSALAHYNLNNCNNDENAKAIIINMIGKKLNTTDIDSNIEWFIAFIKTLSRPFPVFRKSTKKAIFSLMIKCLSFLIGKTNTDDFLKGYTDGEAIKTFLYEINNNNKDFKKLIIETLIARLTAMGSNYILRNGVYKSIKQAYGENKKESDNKGKEDDTFDCLIIKNIKKLVELFGDDTKALRLEKKFFDAENTSNDLLTGKLGLDIFMENNRIFRDGIDELLKKELPVESIFETLPYYLENFLETLNGIFKNNNVNEARRFLTSFIEFAKQLRKQDAQDICKNKPNTKKDYEKLLGDLALALKPKSLILLTNKEELRCREKDCQEKSIIFQPIVKLDQKQRNEGVDIEYASMNLEDIFDRDKEIKQNIWEELTKRTYYFSKNKDFLEVHVLFDNNYVNNTNNDNKQKIHNIVLKLTYDYKNASDNIDDSPHDINDYFALPCAISFGIKALLSQRQHLIKKIEGDFNNNLMQDLVENQEKLALIQGIKFISHSNDHTLWDCYNTIKNGLQALEKSESDLIKPYLHKLISLFSDQTISQIFFNQIIENQTKEDCEKMGNKVLKNLYSFNKCAIELFKVNPKRSLEISITDECLEQKIITSNENDANTLSSLIWGLYNNVLSHGPLDGDPINVYVYVEYVSESKYHYLCIKSDVDTKFNATELMDAMKKVKLTDAEKEKQKDKEKKKGLTFPAVYCFCCELLKEKIEKKLLEKAVIIEPYNEENKFFIIKLLIIKSGGENE